MQAEENIPNETLHYGFVLFISATNLDRIHLNLKLIIGNLYSLLLRSLTLFSICFLSRKEDGEFNFDSILIGVMHIAS